MKQAPRNRAQVSKEGYLMIDPKILARIEALEAKVIELSHEVLQCELILVDFDYDNDLHTDAIYEILSEYDILLCCANEVVSVIIDGCTASRAIFLLGMKGYEAYDKNS